MSDRDIVRENLDIMVKILRALADMIEGIRCLDRLDEISGALNDLVDIAHHVANQSEPEGSEPDA